MKKRLCLIALVCLSVFLSACAMPRNLTTSTPFDADQANKLLAPGKNTIKVNAFLRKRGGDIVTCGGSPVELVPATDLARERVTALYGSPTGGFLNYYASKNTKFTNENQAYSAARRNATCDSDGKAVFQNVADGEFYINTFVGWETPLGYYASTVEGGMLATLVSVKGGETKEVVLTH